MNEWFETQAYDALSVPDLFQRLKVTQTYSKQNKKNYYLKCKIMESVVQVWQLKLVSFDVIKGATIWKPL